MDNLFLKKVPVYFGTEKVQLISGDTMKILTKMKPESVDLIFADPPYFLSNGGVTCQGGKMVSVNKGEWDKLSEVATTIDAKHKFNQKWFAYVKSAETERHDLDIRHAAQYIFNWNGTGAGRVQDNKQYNLAEDKPAAQFRMPLLCPFYGNDLMGQEG